MSINLMDATRAYGRPLGGAGLGGVGSSGNASGADTGGTGPGSFGAMVAQMVGTTAGALGQAEQASIKQVAGKGDLIDVVTAMGAAETALDTMIAVRDKVVSAYGEIMRMQI